MIRLISAHLNALSVAAAPPAPYQYVPFLKPLPFWSDHVWPWLLVPLSVGVAIVYKSIKCRTMREVPKEASILTSYILGGMALAGGVLAAIVWALEASNT